MFVFRPTYPVWSAAPNNVAKVVHGAEVDGRAVVSLVHRLKDEIELKYMMTLVLNNFWTSPALSRSSPECSLGASESTSEVHLWNRQSEILKLCSSHFRFLSWSPENSHFLQVNKNYHD